MPKALVALLVLAFAVPATAADPLAAFPPPDKGMARHVLRLPERGEEAALRVEIIVGKTVLLEPGNRYFFGGRIQREEIKGWGYPRYVVAALGPMAGTRMAVDPNAPKVSRFVTLGGEPYLIRYNSRLPVVVYAPADAEVRYRVWSGEKETRPIEQG